MSPHIGPESTWSYEWMNEKLLASVVTWLSWTERFLFHLYHKCEVGASVLLHLYNSKCSLTLFCIWVLLGTGGPRLISLTRTSACFTLFPLQSCFFNPAQPSVYPAIILPFCFILESLSLQGSNNIVSFVNKTGPCFEVVVRRSNHAFVPHYAAIMSSWPYQWFLSARNNF